MSTHLSTFTPFFQEEKDLFVETLELREKVSSLKIEIVEWCTEANLWKAQHQRAKKREESLKQENLHLKAKIRLREKQLFGKKSEKKKSKKDKKISPTTEGKKKKRKRGQQEGEKGPKRRNYSHLEKRIELIDLPESDKCCKNCGSNFTDTGMTSGSKLLEIEVKGYIRRIERKQYRTACNCKKRNLITAARVNKIIPKGLLGNSIWAHLLVEKYGYGTPLNRIRKSLSLEGISLSQGTVTGGFHKLKPILEAVFEAIKKKGLSESNWNVDETGWPVFEEVEEKANFRWWLWVFRSKSTAFFLLDPSRSAKVIDKYFDKKTSGIINCDRYSAYVKFVRLHEGIILLSFCWAHVRRDFLSLGNKYPKDEEWAMKWSEKIGDLYHANSLRTEHVQGSKAFQKYDRKLRMLLSKFSDDANKQLEDKTLGTHCKKVLESLKKHWKGLTIFVDNPEISMDNNKAERSLRGPVVGRKNYYGSGSKKMGHFAVIMFSIIHTLFLWGINPKKWLVCYFDAYSKLNGKHQLLEEFLPWNMSKEKIKELSLLDKDKPLQAFDTS